MLSWIIGITSGVNIYRILHFLAWRYGTPLLDNGFDYRWMGRRPRIISMGDASRLSNKSKTIIDLFAVEGPGHSGY
jgi:hypothetical protein